MVLARAACFLCSGTNPFQNRFCKLTRHKSRSENVIRSDCSILEINPLCLDNNGSRLRSFPRNSFGIVLEKASPRGSPGVIRRRADAFRAQTLEEDAILVQCGDVLRQGVDVPDGMHERVAHVLTDVCTRFRNQRHAAATDRLYAYQPKAFFDAWQNEQVAITHQFRNIFPVSEYFNARMRQHG